MRRLLVRDLLSQLNSMAAITRQRSEEHLEWINSNLIDFVNEFIRKNKLLDSHFIKGMNIAFKTTRFETLLKKWLVEYLERLFRILDVSGRLVLQDNPINRFGAEKYYARFRRLPEVKWENQPNLLQKIFSILARPLMVLYISLNRGLKFSGKRKKYKVMREAVWGLYNARGYYVHDDFLVDGDRIKKEDLLLFSRGVPVEAGRLKGYYDAQKSPYAHFNLSDLSMGLRTLFSRVIPKYIIGSSIILLREINSANFSLYWSIYLNFKYSALRYEKVFSHFEIISELGHNYFTTSHIAEAIVCQNYGARCYFMNWSDLSIDIDKYMLSFLGCDGYLLWGRAHITGVEGDPQILMPTGYVFKRFIKEVASNRDKILQEMGITKRGKIISFFDESFGGESKMTEENFITFCETAFRLSQIEEGNTILIKPKLMARYHNLADGFKKRFIDLKNKIEKMPNIYTIDEDKWSFIECIGVSDVVVSQGMTSSATIAIICGIEGLYLDEAQYSHPFSKLFKDRIVFDDHEKLLEMINKIIEGRDAPSKSIPETVLRDFDTYNDDMGIERFRDILLCRT